VNISNDVSQAQIASSNVATSSPSARPAAPAGSTAVSGATSGTTGSQASGQSSDPTSDQATISSASGLLSAALNGSDVRTAKVAALQASINAGTYNVPASSVAEKMLSSILGS
jgi:flagellar biosynthesis anti-sigma factor FlgM